MSTIQIEVKNCNNLDSGVISFTPQKLNIKFAPNGTGKSTIARAIIIGASDNSDFGELQPLISTLIEMGNAFKLTKSGLSKASSEKVLRGNV
ncbi:MAG: hypothetical protein D3908_11390 [Candidatus Electrothrix sp. AUS4]|nr:hypothetical protein [Candidatus Electrothrix sp. AUS4]